MKTKLYLLSSVLLTAAPGFAADSVPGSANASASSIATTDGRVYRAASVLRTDPDGIVIQYEPKPGSLGMAKISFRRLSQELRDQFGHEAEAAASYEQQQAQSNTQWRTQLARHEGAVSRYRALAELHRSLAGDQAARYSVSLGADGGVVAQGYTGGQELYSPWAPWIGQAYMHSFGQAAPAMQRQQAAPAENRAE